MHNKFRVHRNSRFRRWVHWLAWVDRSERSAAEVVAVEVAVQWACRMDIKRC